MVLGRFHLLSMLKVLGMMMLWGGDLHHRGYAKEKLLCVWCCPFDAHVFSLLFTYTLLKKMLENSPLLRRHQHYCGIIVAFHRNSHTTHESSVRILV